jgi:pimeloyl-ACP methyl ester carboxylesterase
MQSIHKKMLFSLFFILVAGGFFYGESIARIIVGYRDYLSNIDRINYYKLSGDKMIEDISQKLIADTTIPDNLKAPLVGGKRKIVVFKYKSGEHFVAGYLSYVPHENLKTMLFLRGGNGFLGILRPNNPYSLIGNLNVIGTLYRGNLYGGDDEMGGSEVADVDALIDFIPDLELFIGQKISPPTIAMGVSRGSMEMFAALSRYPRIRNTITHAISVSGANDLAVEIENRIEMRVLYKNKYQQFGSGTFEDWLKRRNPVSIVGGLSGNLKVLILYGTNDNLTFIEEQENLEHALKSHQIETKIIVIPEGNHGLLNQFGRVQQEIEDFIR